MFLYFIFKKGISKDRSSESNHWFVYDLSTAWDKLGLFYKHIDCDLVDSGCSNHFA